MTSDGNLTIGLVNNAVPVDRGRDERFASGGGMTVEKFAIRKNNPVLVLISVPKNQGRVAINGDAETYNFKADRWYKAPVYIMSTGKDFGAAYLATPGGDFRTKPLIKLK